MDDRPLDQRCPWILNPEPHSLPRREINLEPMDPSGIVEPESSVPMTAEEVRRTALYGLCEVCRAPRDIRRTESDDGVLAELICLNGCPQ